MHGVLICLVKEVCIPWNVSVRDMKSSPECGVMGCKCRNSVGKRMMYLQDKENRQVHYIMCNKTHAQSLCSNDTTRSYKGFQGEDVRICRSILTVTFSCIICCAQVSFQLLLTSLITSFWNNLFWVLSCIVR